VYISRRKKKYSNYWRKAQSLSEYAIVFALVGVALLTMQIYIKRAIQGKIKDSADALTGGIQDHYSPERDIVRGDVMYSITDSTTTSSRRKGEFMAENENDTDPQNQRLSNKEFATGSHLWEQTYTAGITITRQHKDY